MPNTLAHLGAQGILSRAWLRSADPRWILLGCVVPDVPWIANRALLFAAPQIPAHELRLYVIAQSSLLCSLLLCGALAALATRWRFVFLILASNALLHLLLDACQTKWGNGVHLLAPWRWKPWNLELFWPESGPTYVLTGLGLVFGAWALRFAYRHPMRPGRPPPMRAAAAGVLLLGYLVLPLLWSRGPHEADSHSVRTLSERSERAGRAVALDRVWLQLGEDGRAFVARGDERIVLRGPTPDHAARVSLRGRFLDAETLLVEEIHEHRFRRDLASYAGLALVAASWVLGLVPRGRGDRGGAGRREPLTPSPPAAGPGRGPPGSSASPGRSAPS